MRFGLGPHLSKQAPDLLGLLTDCKTDTDSEKETLHRMFDNIFMTLRLYKQHHQSGIVILTLQF